MLTIAIKIILACGILVPPSQAQCQTWSTQFGFPNVVGNGIYALKVFDDGTGSKLWVGGDFGASPGVAYIGTWDGQHWSPVCCLPPVSALCEYNAGQGSELYAGYSTDTGYGCISRWTGNGWSLVGGGLSANSQFGSVVFALAEYDSGDGPELFVGGAFNGSQTVLSKGLIRWSGSNWNPIAGGLSTATGDPPYVDIMTVYDDGSGPKLYVAGNFNSIGGTTSPWLAQWDGATWSWNSLGSGVNNKVTGMAVWDDGSGPKLYVSGTFTIAGGVPVSKTAVWNGTSWSAMRVPPVGSAHAMIAYDDGRGPALFYGGFAAVDGMQTALGSRWDGTQWSSVGGGFGNSIRCMASYDDGSGHGPDLYVGGLFVNGGGGIASNKIARWYGCGGPIDSICPGDTTLAQCPCSNPGQFGHGCQNSANTGGALLTSSGTLSPDALHFSISGELPHSLTILLQGDAPTNWTWPFGDGLRCTGGHLLRLFVTNAVNGIANVPGPSDLSITAKAASMGNPIPPGSIRLYQAYYRDPFSGCGTGFNVSNGARIVWPES
jgi:hypothetical protein